MMLKIVLEKKKAYRDDTIIEIARLSKAKRKRKIYSEHLKKETEDESIYYGLLVMMVWFIIYGFIQQVIMK
jgi:hypothetical protein